MLKKLVMILGLRCSVGDDLAVDLAADVEALLALGRRLTDVADQGKRSEITDPLADLLTAAERAGKAWSGSPFGYHSRVYYRGLEPTPPGARFSMEWGFMNMMSNTTVGDWLEFTYEDAVVAINALAGNPRLQEAVALEKVAREAWEDSREEALSILTAIEAKVGDDYFKRLKSELADLSPLTESECQDFQLPSGQRISRDMQAVTEGVRVAPHQAVIAQVLALKSSTGTCAKGAKIINRLLVHLSRQARSRQASVAPGSRVFIGHGGSPLWRELKDFVSDRLHLEWDEFNRVPVAGVSNTDRLAQMLDNAAIAFLVLTAEDELANAAKHPRLNVVHEAGLFQGRLGFSRAIVMLEEGCEAFSNIDGLGQIRFPAGNISACFEKVREVLEREGLLA